MVTLILILLTIGALLLIFVEYAGKVELHLSGLLSKKAFIFYAVVASIYWIKCNVYFG